jgi:hypothetical protein
MDKPVAFYISHESNLWPHFRIDYSSVGMGRERLVIAAVGHSYPDCQKMQVCRSLGTIKYTALRYSQLRRSCGARRVVN